MDSQTFKEIMARYDEKRAQWIADYGTDKGFNEWFTRQVIS